MVSPLAPYFVLLLLTLPSRASSLSSISSLPFGLFLRCGSALPLPQPATPSLTLQTFFCFSPPIFLLPFSSRVPQKQTHRETPTVHEPVQPCTSRSCSRHCPRWGQDFAGAVLSGPSPCPQLPAPNPPSTFLYHHQAQDLSNGLHPSLQEKDSELAPGNSGVWSPKTELIQPPKSPTVPDYEL